jgi:hypothetical protein
MSKQLSSRTANEKWRHVSVYLPPDLFVSIEKTAKGARRSLSAQIVFLLESLAKPK